MDPRSELFHSISVGSVRLRNRVVLPAHTTNFGEWNLPTERNVAYLRERARGGVGLVITEAVRVHPSSAGRHQSLGSFDDSSIGAFANVASAVKEEGAAAFAQIIHLGRQASGDATRTVPWGASAIPWAKGATIPHAMGLRDIELVTRAFGDVTRRMRSAGFDGVEIHAGHGHLIQQFLSPVTNDRNDAYGGSFERRLRFGREVLSEVSRHAGGLPIGLRVSMNEFIPGGLEPESMIEIISALREDFEFAYLHASHSAYQAGYSLSTQMADMHFKQTPFVEHSIMAKQAFPETPIIAVCRVDSLTKASELIETGAADMVALARPHIADPHLVKKALSGRMDEIQSCIACNQACIGRVEQNLPISCVVNPQVGEERLWKSISLLPRREDRRVVVVGGGPAGLKAAVSASYSGANVTLLERNEELGGQVNLASQIGGRLKLRTATDDLIRDLSRTKVDVRLATEASLEAVREMAPDSVLVATGSKPVKRAINGGPETFDIHEAIRSVDRIAGMSGRVVLIDGEGTWAAASLAEELGARGVLVELVSPTPTLFSRVNTYTKANLLARLSELPISLNLYEDVAGVRPNHVTLQSSLTGKERHVTEVAALIDIAPPVAVDALYRALDDEEKNWNLDVIGDANSPRTMFEAIYEGHSAGCKAVVTTPDRDTR